MNRTSFTILLNLLLKEGAYQVTWANGKEPINPEKMLQMALRYFGFKGGMLEISDMFNVCVRTVFVVRNRTINALKKILPKFIKWPQDNDLEIIKQEFQQLGGFPGNYKIYHT